jgi:hypothetical protein
VILAVVSIWRVRGGGHHRRLNGSAHSRRRPPRHLTPSQWVTIYSQIPDTTRDLIDPEVGLPIRI